MNNSFRLWFVLVILLVLPAAMLADEEGLASYYADSLQGNPTASGEPYDRSDLTAAHRTLAFGSMVRVTNQDNGKSVVVRINDRGPYIESRVIDLSRAAAGQIGMLEAGEVKVRIEIIE